MKKVLVLAMLACLAAVPVKATQFWYDVITNYPGGCITTNTSRLVRSPARKPDGELIC